MKIYLICDESGAKGKDKIGEQKEGEVGVFAGCFIPDHKLSVFDSWSQSVASKYFKDGKCHISALPKPDQLLLEREVFDFIKTWNVICAYEAIYAEGFKEGRHSEIQLYENIENLAPSLKNLYKEFKRPLSLHERLFTGLLDKAIAFLTDYCDPSNDELNIFIARVDSGVLRLFKSSINNTIKIGGEKEIPSSPPHDGKSTSAELNDTNELEIIKVLRKLKGNINIDEGDEHLTMVADVVAHSLYQHFMKRNTDKIGASLHDPAAVESHELKGVFYGLSNLLGGMNWWTEGQYMHPNGEK